MITWRWRNLSLKEVHPMERELWPRLYHLVMEVGQTFRLIDVTFQPHIIVLVFFWAALHDRPVCWACDAAELDDDHPAAGDAAQPLDPQPPPPPRGHRDVDAGLGGSGSARAGTRG